MDEPTIRSKEDNGGQGQHGPSELSRKRGLDGDVDFLREALRVLVEGNMDAEVTDSEENGSGDGLYRYQKSTEPGSGRP